MTTTTDTAMRALLAAGQEAVRAVERRATPETIAALDAALCGLPILDMDDQAYGLVLDAVRALSLAQDAETWTLLNVAERAVSRLLIEPQGESVEEGAVMAVAFLSVHCSVVHDRALGGSPESAAWYRAYQAGVDALRTVTSVVNGNAGGAELDKTMTRFLDAVRRAVPYAALYEARWALVEFARTYRMFVVGMRQPMTPGGDWEWARRLGGATYLFRVDPPGMDGYPYGSVAVQRVVEGATAGDVRHFPLYSFGEQRNALNEARYRI